jgi:hypothetical protein
MPVENNTPQDADGPSPFVPAGNNDTAEQVSTAKPASTSERTSTDQKLFGKYHEVALLTLGFVFTSLFGGGLTFLYQEIAASHARQEQMHIAAVQRASDTFGEISRLMDKRVYRTRRVLWAMRDNLPEPEIKERRTAYAETVREWNESLNRYYALTELSFGHSARIYLESAIFGEFRCISALLNAQTPDFSKIESRLDTMNPWVYKFNEEMLRRIQDGQVGVFQKETSYETLVPKNLKCK